MSDNGVRAPISLVPSILIGVAVVGFLMFLSFYKTDGNPTIATSPYSTDKIVATMEETEHIRFVEELGITPSGKTLFSYRWVDYGIFDAFSCYDEVEEVSEALDMKVVKR